MINDCDLYLEDMGHRVAVEVAQDDQCTAGLILHSSEALSAKRTADALEGIAETLGLILETLNTNTKSKENALHLTGTGGSENYVWIEHIEALIEGSDSHTIVLGSGQKFEVKGDAQALRLSISEAKANARRD